MDISLFLNAIEARHRAVVGEQFCYVAVPSPVFRDHYVLGITRRTEHGYFPISEDVFIGQQQPVQQEADRLTRERLNLFQRDAALIVAASLHQLHHRE